MRRRDSLALAESLEPVGDVMDSLDVNIGENSDTLAVRDTLAAADTAAAPPKVVREPSEKEKKQALKEQERARRTAAREARWKVKDDKDAAARAAKEEKKKIRKRRKTLKLLKAQAERERIEQERLMRYKEHYLKKQTAEIEKAAGIEKVLDTE